MPLQLKATKYPGVMIKFDPGASAMFPAIVEENLAILYKKPVGKLLLDEIGASGQEKFGYKVCILRPDMQFERTVSNPLGWKGTNTAKRINEIDACNPQKGTQTAVYWNPNSLRTPDGTRPPFIGLAHELVHALHNLKGLAKSLLKDEEEWTVGLNQYLTVLPNENAIRAEHDVSHRSSYDGDNFTVSHDASRFGTLNIR